MVRPTYIDLVFGLYHLPASPVPRASQIDAKLNILMVKKENVIPQRLTEFTMHHHIFSTKWRQNTHFSPAFDILLLRLRIMEQQIVISGVRTVGTNLCKLKTPVLLFFRSSLAALISICGLSDPVKTLIESFVGGPRLSFCSFSDYWEEWNCESRGNKNLNNKGGKVIVIISLSDIDATIIIVLPLNHLNSRFDKITEHAMWPTFLRYQNTWPHAMIIL